MRIRKRQVPFPLSSLSPIPISDPLINLNQPPPVVVQLHHYDPSRNDAVNLHPHGNPSREPYPATHFTPQPSDRPVNHRLSPIGAGNINRRTDGCDFSDADNRTDDHKDTMNNKKKEDRLELFLKDGEDNKGDDISKGSTPSAEANSRFSFPESTISSTSPSQVVMKTSYWCEGEKVFPLKKRRGSFLPGEEEDGNNYHDYHHKEQHNKKITTNVIKTVKAKTAQKKESNSSRKNDDISNQQQYDDDHHNQHNHQLGSNNSGKSNKKGRGGALVEGSRCSRVNGRGWRCCQQTLVGYSLCEHHLGKGRLRSMTSVRSRSMLAKSSSPSSSSAATAITTAQMGSLHEVKQEKEPKLHRNVERMIRDSIIINEEDDDEDDDEDDYDDDDDDEDYGEHDFEKNKNKNKKKPLKIANKKRVKLGMVKARSISSLLGQTNSCTTSTGTTGAISMADSKY